MKCYVLNETKSTYLSEHLSTLGTLVFLSGYSSLLNLNIFQLQFELHHTGLNLQFIFRRIHFDYSSLVPQLRNIN
uniref:Uncharacterized protein n=1 Tax=Arundo donax TaxID=35708 RepID=A0A0A8XT48_ARUDO